MVRLISRGRFTQSTVAGQVKMPEDREIAVRKLVEASGAKLVGFYITTGDSDFMVIAEAPDAESIVAGTMARCSSRRDHGHHHDAGVDRRRVQGRSGEGVEDRRRLPRPWSGAGKRRLVGLTMPRGCVERLRLLSFSIPKENVHA